MNLYIPKNCSYKNYFGDPAPNKEKQLSIVYLNINNDEMQTIVNSESEVVLIQVKKILKAFYGNLSIQKETDVTDKVSKLLTNKPIVRDVTNVELMGGIPLNKKEKKDCPHCPSGSFELPPLNTKIEGYIWKPSGGLGHCLHNLAWMCNKVKEERTKLFIYGCEKHIPLQVPFSDVFEIVDKNIVYEEIRDINTLCKKFNLSKENRILVEESDYKVGLKYLRKDKTLAFVCATWSNRLDNMIRIKKDYILQTIQNPLKYFNKTFNLINTVPNKIINKFEISGSYVAALGVTNKHLNIDPDDKKSCSMTKILTIKYKNRKGENKVEEIKEKTKHTITDISEIIQCTYGIPNKIHDVTGKVIKNLCSYENNNFDSNKQLKQVQNIINKENFIAVHYRGRDKKAQGGEKKKLQEIKELTKINKISNVFVATDCHNFYDYLCKNLDGLTVFRYTNPPKKGCNVHYNTKDFKRGENIFKTVLDMTVCIKAKHFIPSLGSGFSTLVREFSKSNYL